MGNSKAEDRNPNQMVDTKPTRDARVPQNLLRGSGLGLVHHGARGVTRLLLEFEVNARAFGLEAAGFGFGEEQAFGFDFAALQNIFADGFCAVGREPLKILVGDGDAVEQGEFEWIGRD